MQSQENTIKAFLRTAVDLHQEHWDRDIGTSLMKINDLFETLLKTVTEPLLGSALKGPVVDWTQTAHPRHGLTGSHQPQAGASVGSLSRAVLLWGHGRVLSLQQNSPGACHHPIP